ncbi:cation-translocating P-type ATPase [Tessaracoccus sp. MC1865]|uniref:heavy metal translocating P-type ATPase n=1 Tax=Tessaracoccus sp. MC1865 TaxID=2760310 RepID=UPI0015FEEDE4|nr:cation-translocating P-type ATPase [Tessaracoccus sp. MC1865]MBB1482965.1 cation-translocating P-type ATPase [Tessaracoccus sp. MC1865]QTO37597.1 cation-translocating P-type ATPase [Tessaracoccus sp. MC1865]
MHARLHRWAIPAVSGALIVVALVLGQVAPSAGEYFMLAAAVVAGAPVVKKAWLALRVKVIGIDLLVAVAAIGAIAIANYWEAAAVTFLFALGHALENATLAKTRSALAELVALAPTTATVIRDGEQVEVPAHTVEVGETVIVKNGGRVPVDADVVSGQAAVDEAAITGESIPVEKSAGSEVYAGTIVADGFLTLSATGVGADTTLARIVHRVEEAQDAKARTQQFMERFSKWYTPGIIALAVVVGLLTMDLELALTLLVIGCPGALVISVPVALVAGIGRAARDGILIKGGEFLETAAKIDVVALDKTGTITRGEPRLTDIMSRTLGDDEVLRWAAQAEAGSEHPLAVPVLDEARERGITVPAVPEHVRSVPGHGVVAMVQGREVAVGNVALIEKALRSSQAPAGRQWAEAAVEELSAAGRTPLLVALDGDIIGALGVADTVRDEAAELVASLHAAGVKRVLMLTGDNQRVADSVAAQVGIDDARASLLPEDKLEVIRQLQAEGHTVAMVGDGVNDAPALALADVGIAMGAAGSPVAVETADIALMTSRLSRIPDAISLAKRTAGVMRANIVIALITVGTLLAGVLFGGVTMAIGMLVHEASVLVVIVNAMRLLRRRTSASQPRLRPRVGDRQLATERKPELVR